MGYPETPLGMMIRREMELWRISKLFSMVDDDKLKALWDEYDGINSPEGYAGEDIHFELSRRGYKDYCSV